MEKLGVPFVDSDICLRYGKPPDKTNRNSHIYYVTIPIKRTHRQMSRWYQYLLSDVMLVLKHDYLKKIKSIIYLYMLIILLEHIIYIGDTSQSNFVAYEVAIGYRNSDSTKWNMLASGNSTRALDCSTNKWVYMIISCGHHMILLLIGFVIM